MTRIPGKSFKLYKELPAYMVLCKRNIANRRLVGYRDIFGFSDATGIDDPAGGMVLFVYPDGDSCS